MVAYAKIVVMVWVDHICIIVETYKLQFISITMGRISYEMRIAYRNALRKIKIQQKYGILIFSELPHTKIT